MQLNNASPLEIGEILLDYEIYSQESSEEILDDIYEEFENEESFLKKLIKPAFYNMSDNLVRKLKLSKYGITPSRIIEECKDFSYPKDEIKKNEGLKISKDNPEKYKNMRDQEKMNNYKDEYFDNNKMGKDEYTNKKIYKKTDDAKNRNYKSKTSKYHADLDHIVPCETVLNRYKNNPYLGEDDIRKILNKEENYAVTNANLNRSKKNQSNIRHVKKKNLNKDTEENMIKSQINAETSIAISASKKAGENKALGDVFVNFIKGIYFEMNDAFEFGITHGLNTSDTIEAFILRFKRVSKYVKATMKNTLKSSLFESFKTIITSLVDIVIRTFSKIIVDAWKVIMQGFNSIIEAIKLILNPPENMSNAQIADAVVKLLSTTVIGILAFNFESYLNSIGIVDPISGIITGILSGLIVAFVTYFLDEIDLFNAKREIRMARIEEVFNKRKKEIKEKSDDFDEKATKELFLQRVKFDNIVDGIYDGLQSGNYTKMNDSLYNMADFLNIEIEHSNKNEFLDYLDESGAIEI